MIHTPASLAFFLIDRRGADQGEPEAVDLLKDPLDDRDAVFPNGHAVEDGAPSRCGAVGSSIHMGELGCGSVGSRIVFFG
jgi:hypothetical protein